MRTIDELGISKTPWKFTDNLISTKKKFIRGDGIEFAWLESLHLDADARLIAAAPELYQALSKMQECFNYIRSTAWFMDANFASIQEMTKAQNEAKYALAKASGEEAE